MVLIKYGVKNFTIILFLGFLGGLFGSYLFLNYFTEIYLANILQPSLLVQSLVSPVSNSSPWEKTITDSFSGTVAVQTFLDNKIVRQGTGIVLSSDGIVATVADLEVPGAVYQIYYNDKISRGVVVKLNHGVNVLLLKTQDTYGTVVNLGSNDYPSGREIAIVGKTFSLSELINFSQRGIISYVSNKITALDVVANHTITGASVIDLKGDIIGLSYTKNGKVNVAKSTDIKNLFNDYIAKNNGG